MTYTKRKSRREYRASVFDGRGIARVWIVDGYDRPVTDMAAEQTSARARAARMCIRRH
jgi:hypothetical protein